MQRLEVSGAVRPIYESLGVKRLIVKTDTQHYCHEYESKIKPVSTQKRYVLVITR